MSTSATVKSSSAPLILMSMVESNKKAKVTDVHREEARALKEIWARVKPRNQKEFATEFGIGGQTAVSNFLNGTSALSLKAATGFAAGLGCRIEDFSPRLAAEAAQIAEVMPQSIDDEFTQVRRASVKFSNGTGKVVYYEHEKPPLVFRTSFLRRVGISPGKAVIVEAEGISNEPKIIDGAVVLINTGDKENLNGDFFAFRADGELLIKRLQNVPGVGVLATAENPNFKPKQKIYKDSEDFEVIGRSVWTGALL